MASISDLRAVWLHGGVDMKKVSLGLEVYGTRYIEMGDGSKYSRTQQAMSVTTSFLSRSGIPALHVLSFRTR